MTSNTSPVPRLRTIRWVALGALGGLLLGLLAALLVRPVAVDDRRVSVPTDPNGNVYLSLVGGTLSDGRGSDGLGFGDVVRDGLPVSGQVFVDRGNVTTPTLSSAISRLDLPTEPGLVVIELGNTDFYVEGTSPADLESMYSTLLERVRETSPKEAIVCLGLWGKEDEVREFDDVIREVCSLSSGTFVRISDLFQTPGMRDEADEDPDVDTFHPNAAGHRQIADRILASVRVD